MRFEIEGAVPIDDVTPEQVEQGLRMLQLSDRTFAILDRAADSYIQTAVDGAGDGDGTFVLEYQEGSLAQHYRANRSLTLGDVIAAFHSYLRQDGAWQAAHAWERMEL